MNAIKSLNLLLLMIVIASFNGCGVNSSDYARMKESYNAIKSECDSVKQVNTELNAKVRNDMMLIRSLRDSISILSFPADQRIRKIKNLITEEKFSDAKKEITNLAKVFPESKEAKEASALLGKVDELEKKKKLEEEKRKALGFKGVKTVASCTIGYNKVEISNISTGNTFTFDSYDDRYHYRTADRGNKYITAVMRITSDSKDPKLPQPAIYSIVAGKMKLEGYFTVEFARWEDYGAYLGNYHDNGNDFAKTSSIRFKIGKEVSEEVLKKPYAVVLKKENALVRKYERFDNPPVSYNGSVDYPYQLTLEDFSSESGNYYLLKIANL